MTVTYRADHVGSLLRPPKLLKARTLFYRAQLDQDELTKLEDEAILEALELHRQAGMDVFTDGEYRRPSRQRGAGTRGCRQNSLVQSTRALIWQMARKEADLLA